MKYLLSLFSAIFPSILFSQTLDVPARNSNAMTGDEFVSYIWSMSLEDRENAILSEITTGNVPDFYRNMILIKDSIFDGNDYIHIQYYAIPDYLAIGHDTNYFLCPMTPILGQKVADTTNCLLPTRKMVNQIAATSTVKMQPEPISPSPQMTTVPVFNDHNITVGTQRATFLPGLPLGELTAGDKKDVIISNLIYTSPAPRRVIIYGWHYPNGSNIQPMYNGHIDTYADYSHGIRLVQKEMYVDGMLMDAADILSSTNLHELLSDEGVINIPFYPTDETTPAPPNTPSSFCVLNNNVNSLQIHIDAVSGADEYKLYESTDGINFSLNGTFSNTSITVNSLNTNSIYYYKLKASNTGGDSPFSEVLAAVPSSLTHRMLVVNGFDRGSTGNTYDFIRQHGQAIMNYGFAFSSATNEAMNSGLLSINVFEMMDYILGEESTIDETFSNSEQVKIKSFLNNGGELFVSGAEIGWDLDFKGTNADSAFYADYLKATYVLDAPDNTSSTYYDVSSVSNDIFNGIASFSFDDGTNGTYNVDYPDVIEAASGGSNCLLYAGVSNQYAAVKYAGLFPQGTNDGKIVNMGFPFETVYPESSRFKVMSKVLDFFEDNTVGINSVTSHNKYKVYPNPFSNRITVENYNGEGKIKIYDLLGKELLKESISNKLTIDLSHLKQGIYILELNGTTTKISKF